MGDLVIHLTSLARDLQPVPGSAGRDWWDFDERTRGHAKHCLPLLMANRLGWVVRSPGSFQVTWDGDWDREAVVDTLDSQVIVDAHSAGGSFTVQPGFVARTTEVDDFLMVRPLPNVRGAWFSAMEALIEAWWQPGEFGLVCMLHRPGVFNVKRGEPLAQLCVYRASGGAANLMVLDGVPPETKAWRERRYRDSYRKDLDYFRGRHPDGTPELTHRTSWRSGRA